MDIVKQQEQSIQSLQDTLESLQMQLIDASEEHYNKTNFINAYGFFSTGFQRLWVDQQDIFYAIAQNTEWTFILEDLHLYLDINPSPGWRGLFEFRVNTSIGIPWFDQRTGSFTLLNTAQRRLNRPHTGWGGAQLASILVLERAYIEYSNSDALGIRLGLWLTPFGIWNVDHGYPALIALVEPIFLSYQALPTSQIGLALFGTIYIRPWDLSYHLGLSNGRMSGPDFLEIPWTNYDFNNDKMISGRLQLRNSGYHLTFGLSGYWGETDTISRSLGSSGYETSVETRLREWGVGADLRFDYKQLKLRAEFSYIQHFFEGTSRPGSPQNRRPDSAQFEGYLVTALSAPLMGITIEPYVSVQPLWWPGILGPHKFSFLLGPGFNIFFKPNIQLKNQLQIFLRYSHLRDRGALIRHENDIISWSTRLVISF